MSVFKTYLFTIILFLSINRGYTQKLTKVDSLIYQMEQASDTVKVNLLNDIGVELQYNDPHRALDYAKEGLQLAERLDYKRGIANLYNDIGVIYGIQADYYKALEYFLKSLEIKEAIGHPRGIANSLNNIAEVYKFQNDHKNAIAYFKKALEIKRSLPDKRNLLFALHELGIAYATDKQFKLSDSCFMQLIQVSLDHGLDRYIPRGYYQLGKNFTAKGAYLKGIEYFQFALKSFNKHGDKQRESDAVNDIGNNFMQLKNYDSAQYYHQKCLVQRREIGFDYGTIESLLQISKVYVAQGRLREALASAKESYDISHRLNIRERKREALKEISNIYNKQKQFALALSYYQQYAAQNDSIIDERKTRQIAEMQAKYDLARKEEQINNQKNEIMLLEEKKRADNYLKLTLVIAVIFLLVLSLITYSRFRIKQKSESLLRDKNDQIKIKNNQIKEINLELEKRMLRAQMDPHFIFNSLNSIQHFITINDKLSTLKYLSKFSKLIRQVLDNSVNVEVPIADEIKLLEHYIELEILRFNNPFQYEIAVDDTIDIHTEEIPFLLIQPYVENAILHGLIHKKEAGALKISFNRRGEYILCGVEDNGIGRKAANEIRCKTGQAPQSRGMSVTACRLELINKNKHNKTLVTVIDLHNDQDQPCGTRVEILIPAWELKSNLIVNNHVTDNNS